MSSSVDYLLHGYIEHQVPFCKPFVCPNLNQTTATVNGTAQATVLWECMPASCKTKLIGFLTVIIILSFFITIFNAAVFVINLTPSTRRVFRRNPTMRNYSTYVISLSFTDFLIGAVVLPLAIALFCQEMLVLRTSTTKKFYNQKNLSPAANFSQKTEVILTSQSTTFQTTIPSNGTAILNQTLFLPDDFEAKSKTENSNPLICVLGFFTQLCVFVSMYTLTAASVDRFYVSRKATCNPTIKLSSSSLKTGLTCGERSFYPSFRPSRSGIGVFVIWILGVILSWLPLGMFNEQNYQPVGYIFVLISFSNFYLTLFWYIITLVIPFLLTWLFSGLLCYVLWRRKQKLKKCSRALQRQECYSDRRTDEKEYDSSFALSTRFSNADSPTFDPANTSCDQSEFQINEGLPKIVIDTETASESDQIICPLDQKKFQRPKSLALSPSSPRRKRSSSFNIFWTENETTTEISVVQENLAKTGPTKGLLKSHSFQNVRGSHLAKRILLKVSWEGVTAIDDHSLENTPTSSVITKRSNSPVSPSRPIRFAESPVCSPSTELKGDNVRFSSSRITRRRSSIYRAKEFMMSNTFESNVTKSLMAVVIALSFSILPLLFMFPQLARHDNSEQVNNKDVSFLVSAVTVLLSNSLWNCLIYGSRTRYFRTYLGRTCSRWFSCCHHRSSLTKQLSQIFSSKTSFFNTGNESK